MYCAIVGQRFSSLLDTLQYGVNPRTCFTQAIQYFYIHDSLGESIIAFFAPSSNMLNSGDPGSDKINMFETSHTALLS